MRRRQLPCGQSDKVDSLFLFFFFLECGVMRRMAGGCGAPMMAGGCGAPMMAGGCGAPMMAGGCGVTFSTKDGSIHYK